MENRNASKDTFDGIKSMVVEFLKKYFNAMPDKENEEETIRGISAGVSLKARPYGFLFSPYSLLH